MFSIRKVRIGDGRLRSETWRKIEKMITYFKMGPSDHGSAPGFYNTLLHLVSHSPGKILVHQFPVTAATS